MKAGGVRAVVPVATDAGAIGSDPAKAAKASDVRPSLAAEFAAIETLGALVFTFCVLAALTISAFVWPQ